ncbi:Intraflagellar transport protein 57, partial [Tetrabaena socialis]
AAWLLTLAGVEFPAPKEYDDPNITCGNLLNAVKKLGFAPPSYHPTKLTVGNGKEVVGVLDGLVDYVLERTRHTYKRPQYSPQDGQDLDLGAEDEAETAAMEGADEFAMPPQKDGDDEEEEEGVFADPGRDGAGAGAGSGAGIDSEKAVLVSKVDPTLWKIELERVAPKLRITIAADSKDWRSHLDEAHQHKEVINKAWPDSKQSLERLRADLNSTLEKLQTREKFLNEQFEGLMQQYRASRTTLTDVQETYNRKTEAVADRNSELHRIAEQLEEVKAMMDEKGSNIADATPVARIKTAIKQLNKELHDMEVRIGVVSHTLLQLSLRNKRLLQAQAALSDEDED